MVQTGAPSGPLVRLVSPKVELYEDAGIHSPKPRKFTISERRGI